MTGKEAKMFRIGQRVTTPQGVGTVLAIGTVHPDGAMPTVVVNLDAGGITRVTGNALYGVTAN
jgi:hypothetical protein